MRHAMGRADAAWLHMDRPTNLMVINALLWFDQPVDWVRLREVVTTRIVERFPKFRQRITHDLLGRAAWEDDPNFDLDLHFHRLGLPARGDRAALQDLVQDLMALPLDRTKPLWHMYLVDGYGEGAAFISRIHHCMADGVTLARVMMLLMDETAGGEFEEPREPRPDKRGGLGGVPVAGPMAGAVSGAVSGAVHLGGALVHEGLETVAHPGRVVDAARFGTETAEALAKLLAASPDPRTPLRQELGVPRAVAWSDPLPLDAIRAVGRALDATLNDVLVSCVAGALGRHLRARDGLVDELRALVPFNLRPLDRPLPRDLGNKFGLILLGLPVAMEDRVERVLEVKRRMDEVKRSKEGPVGYGVLAALGVTPTGVEARVIDFFTARGTLVLTNVPGPPEVVYVAGTPVRGVLVWAPCAGSIGMTVAIFSYRGEVTVGLMADRGLVHDPGEVVDEFGRELRETAAAVDTDAATEVSPFRWDSLRRRPKQ